MWSAGKFELNRTSELAHSKQVNEPLIGMNFVVYYKVKSFKLLIAHF